MATETLQATFRQLAAWAHMQARDLVGTLSWKVPLKRCRVAVLADVRKNFAEGHDPDGNPWLPLKHPRARTGGGGEDKPLRDRGPLLASLVGQSAEGHVEELTDTLLELGTNLPYAHTHQQGSTIKGNPYLAIPLTR